MLTLTELAAFTGAQFVGDPTYTITGVNTLDEALPSDLSFLANPRYEEAMKRSKAGVVCIAPGVPLLEGRNFLISEQPSHTFQKIVEHLLAAALPKPIAPGIHSTAIIHPTARIGKGVSIAPYVVIEEGAAIGDGTIISSHCHIGRDVELGTQCHIHPSCVIRERCKLGDRVILQPGVVIGSCGFGYLTNAAGVHVKLEQLGNVILENDVEIGANSTIDRARFQTTRVRKGTKIDNLVQIGHNVEVGEKNLIAAQTGVAGSAKTGAYVMLGGQCGILGHISLEDGVMVATRGGVSKSLKKGAYRGSPAIPIADYNRQEVYIRRLEQYAKRLEALEKQLKEKE